MNRHRFLVFTVFLAALLLVAGCTTAPSSKPTSAALPSSAPMQPAIDDPKLAETIAWLDTAAAEQQKEWNIPGMAVAVVKDGKIVFAKAYGTKRYGTNDPVTTESVFQIGSTSKQFTATTVALEVDRGRMNWTDPVVWYVPGFRLKDPAVTKEYSLTDSMAQRSGIPDNWGLDIGLFGYNRSETITALQYADPQGTFRKDYSYQNLPWNVAAAATEKTSQMSWDENIRTGIFVPLNITSGSTTIAGFAAQPDHVTLHRMVRLGNGTIVPYPMETDWPFNSWSDTMSPPGGLSMNIRDFATWAAFQAGNGTWNGRPVVSRESMEYMHSPKIQIPGTSPFVANASEYYAQGWIVEESPDNPTLVWHNGNAIGGHAMVMIVPEADLGVVVLENEAGPTAGDGLAFQFYNKYFLGREDPALFPFLRTSMENGYTYLYHPATVTRPANPSPPLPLANYTGNYVSNEYGPATVTTGNGNLTLAIGRTPVAFILTPWDGNTFTSACPAWGPDYQGFVTFGTDADGSVRDLSTSLFLETNLYHRNATFSRPGTVYIG